MKKAALLLILVVAAVVIVGDLAEAQQPKKVPLIGLLSAGFPPPHSRPASERDNFEAFYQGLQELGYIREKNIIVEFRYAQGKFERFPELAAELVRLNVDVIVAPTTLAIRAAKQATNKIPIV